ncbi:hypothetical protein NC651_022956 [Populus alba x Populus x berolinensis]|nr:hypothetical protein NC651_022956 [Populus alba x Populus x berolinensis]
MFKFFTSLSNAKNLPIHVLLDLPQSFMDHLSLPLSLFSLSSPSLLSLGSSCRSRTDYFQDSSTKCKAHDYGLPEIAGVAKRWGGAPTCEQDYDVPTKPWCLISRCGSTAISRWRSLYSNGTFALSATFISLVTNVGLDTFRQIVALNSCS